FYNTFTARVDPGVTSVGAAEVSADPVSGDVYALPARRHEPAASPGCARSWRPACRHSRRCSRCA
ncbi:hypothetical protein CTI14_43830, partial [Methylobacterium radiotolerans]